MTSHKKIQPTYSELAKALTAIKLADKSNEALFVFKNQDNEVVVQLPNGAPNTAVNMARFIALTYNLADLGILRHPHNLGKSIEQMRLAQQQHTA